jgi:hypothetical protein
MDFISILFIFMFACCVCYVVWPITPALHTPLMAVANAISSAIVAGALIAAAPALAAGPADMAGRWTVDLRPSLGDKPYTQPMVLAIAPDGTVTGSFYSSDILAGRTGSGQGRQCVAFRTTDSQGLYHSQACLVDGRMVGSTWAEGRNFLLPWTAER